MAEQEISKHTKQIFKIAAADHHSIWHKLREFVYEIVIIVFAVSISIWLHGIGEHHHEQEQVKTFLLGLKVDLQNDVDGMAQVIAFHQKEDEAYRYLAGLNPSDRIDEQKFDQEFAWVWSSSRFQPEANRYEGFRSGGKLTNIENEKLLEDLLNYYQVQWPISQEINWSAMRSRLHTYLQTADEKIEDRNVQFKMMSSPKGKFLAKGVITNDELYDRYRSFAEQGKQLIKEIDLAYPDQATKK